MTENAMTDAKPRARQKLRIGDLLVQNKVISEQQLQSALKEQKKTGHKLGNTLIELGYLDEMRLLNFLSQQLQIPFVDLPRRRLEPHVVQKLPETIARRYRVILLEDRERDVLLGMADPTDLFGYDEVARVLGKRVSQAVVRESDLLQVLDRLYSHSDELSNLAGELDEELSQGDVDLGLMMQSSDASDAPVFRLLQTLFEDALRARASDIHIEPDEDVLRIRQRVDGVLQEHVMNERRIAPALVQRLKLLASLDISEKRLPQDGRFQIKLRNHKIDVRLSTMPIQNGEAVVMRLLDQTSGILSLDQLGIEPDMLKRIRSIIQQPHGMLLVTGPTGSGKTTTLYAALSELNSPERKIITVEDPVEYRLPRINQVQVHEQIDLTFARVLRTALRQDPDVVLVGEMRDLETAQIGLRAAITGHFVMSTLHTNSAVDTVARLLDMGAPGYLMASALQAVMAQRLARRVCPECRQPMEPGEHQSAWLRAQGGSASDGQFMKGTGCNHCNNTGYRGRVGIYELLELDGDMLSALRREDLDGFAAAAAASSRFETLSAAALRYARSGVTSLDEAMRISGEQEMSG